MAEWLKILLQEELSSGGAPLVWILVFVGGVLASFTPCTYPVLPLTMGYIGNAAGGSRGDVAHSIGLGWCCVSSLLGPAALRTVS